MKRFNFKTHLLCIFYATITYAQWTDPSPHHIRFIKINSDIRLEVLDWGGTGKPLLFLAGLGNSTHIFDDFAPQFTDSFHVLGLTRRGFGSSSQPALGYDISTLASDILGVLDNLKLKRVTLIGHSIAGDELTKFAVTYPDRVEKLVYLDAAHDRTGLLELFKYAPQYPTMTKADSASISALRNYWAHFDGVFSPEAEIRAIHTFYADGRLKRLVTPDTIMSAIIKSIDHPKYTDIKIPTLAFYSIQDSAIQMFSFYSSLDSVNRDKADQFYQMFAEWARTERERFRREVKNGYAIEMHGANHYLFISHAAEVTQKMRTFLVSK